MRKQQMSASLITTSAPVVTAPVASMEVAAPVLVASPEVEKKGSKRARKEPAPAGGPSDGCVMKPVEAAPKGKKKTPPTAKPMEGEEAPQAEASAEEVCEGERKEAMCSSLIVAKAIRVLLKSHSTPIHLGSDALPALNAKVTELIYEAIGRALANGRKTLKNSDF